MMRTLIVFVTPRPDAEQDALRAVLRRLGRPVGHGLLEDHGTFLIGCVAAVVCAGIAVWLWYTSRPAARVGAHINGPHARPRVRKGVPSWR
jgi:hypothetical protein